MIHNLELYDEDDGRYDDEYVQFVIETFFCIELISEMVKAVCSI